MTHSMDRLFPSTVKCKITGCEHKVVYKNQNKRQLIDFCHKIVEKIDSGASDNAYIAIDIEGKTKFKSVDDIGMIQFAQFYTDKGKSFYWKYDPTKPYHINLRNGFIVIEPDDEAKAAISNLLNHSRVYKVFFNITRDLPSLFNNGIEFNPYMVIDTQVRRSPSLIDKYSLSQAIDSLDDFIEHSQQAKQSLTIKHEMNFSVRHYHYKDISDREALNKYNEILEYSSNDIIYTALSLFSFMKYHGSISAGWKLSRQKCDFLMKLHKMYPAAPILKVQLYFLKKTLTRISQKPYQCWAMIDAILPHYNVLRSIDNQFKFKLPQLLEIKKKCDNLIAQHPDKAFDTIQDSDSLEKLFAMFKIGGDFQKILITLSKYVDISQFSDPTERLKAVCNFVEEHFVRFNPCLFDLIINSMNQPQNIRYDMHQQFYNAIFEKLYEFSRREEEDWYEEDYFAEEEGWYEEDWPEEEHQK